MKDYRAEVDEAGRLAIICIAFSFFVRTSPKWSTIERAPPAATQTAHSFRGQLSVQQKHIAQGIKSGELNAKQVGKIESREAQLEAQMRSDRRADNGGKLTATQRKQLIRDENRIAKKIRELENIKPTAGT